MILEDIPIFYLASKDPQTEFYWGYTGHSMFDKTKHNPHRQRVYFTDELLDSIVWRQISEMNGNLELKPTPDGTKHHWLVKHVSGYIWRLERDLDLEGYVLGVWPD